ncbi:MAG: CHAP domain-containing protein [Pseudomonadota bacterium]
MSTRSILIAATALAGLTAQNAEALAPWAMDDSVSTVEPQNLMPDATLAPHAFERRPDAQFVPNARLTNRRANLQCVPFARREAGIQIYGDANTWWAQAQDRYQRITHPQERAVMVLYGYAGADRGHVAVIRQIVSGRLIIVDHANWLNHGEITRDVPVRDVSPDGDWSQVQVWNVAQHHWGSRTYSVQGFILNVKDKPGV